MAEACCSYSILQFPLTAPPNLEAAPTDTTIVLTWDAVENAASYEIMWTPGGGTVQTTPETTFTIPDLVPGNEYTVQVRAVPADGSKHDPSAWATVTATTTGDKPQLAAPTGVSVSQTTPTSGMLGWNTVEGADGYAISWALASTPDTPVGSATATQAPFQIAGLTQGTDYIASIVATDSTGMRTDSDPATAEFSTTSFQPLPTPTGIAASAITDTSATVSWGAVADANQYTVTYEPGGATPLKVTEPTIDLTGLNPGVDYTVSVIADDTTGGHISSPPGTGTFSTTGTPTPLNPPQNIEGSSITATSATVSWDPVTGADGYTLTYDPGGLTPIPTTTASMNLTGLVASTDYTINVTATDSTGAASESDPGQGAFTTLAALVPTLAAVVGRLPDGTPHEALLHVTSHAQGKQVEVDWRGGDGFELVVLPYAVHRYMFDGDYSVTVRYTYMTETHIIPVSIPFPPGATA